MTAVADVAPERRRVPGHGRDAGRVRLAAAVRLACNLIGALGAAYFVRATLLAFIHTHRPVGLAFLAQEVWVVVAYLVRRPARSVSTRLRDWVLAFGGTFGGVLLRPSGTHVSLNGGLAVQIAGLVLCVWSFFALGRSFGFAAADRGLAERGPYAVVRHPVYASYVLVLSGYLLQSVSLRNATVVLFVIACNAGRAVVEERLLAESGDYRQYATRVRSRIIPGVW